jgi:Zn-dependent protease with chaperone function
MDFFEAQEHARRRTHRLVVLFAFAVLGTIGAGYFTAVAVLRQTNQTHTGRDERIAGDDQGDGLAESWWDPRIFAGVTLGTLAIVGSASLFKWATMRQGGSAIAESVGGRRVDPKSTDFHERQLLNVVEEMAIASGVPTPAVYVLDNEPCLNAFAAGLTTSDAAVTVTRGTLEKLTRDELQGVIAHEFSHILNGDMRLNVSITAIVFGILVIGLLGRGFLQSVGRVRGGKNSGGVIAVIVVVGLALLIIGYIGYFFGRLIQAAVSRQREFLADASAVQFTRNPGGISGALKKIGGYALGSKMQTGKVEQLSHFFFAQGFQSMFGGAWATHPPLNERIRAIEPTWDGKVFDPPEVVDISTESAAIAGFGAGPRFAPDETSRRVQEAVPDLPPPLPPRSMVSMPFKPVKVVADVGALTEAHFRQAQSLLESIPASLRDATRDTAAAQVLVYGLLLDGDKAMRDRQQQLVAQHAGADAASALGQLRPTLSVLDPLARLPLLQLSLPALRALDAAALDRFATTLDELVHADGRVTPFEFALQKMLLGQLRLAQTPMRAVQFDSFDSVSGEIAVVLSALARIGSTDQTAIAAAFAAGTGQLPVVASQLALLAPEMCGLEQVDAALDKLAVSSLPIKRRLLVAAGHVIAADGTITEDEGELFRALTATLDCPMPTLGLAA